MHHPDKVVAIGAWMLENGHRAALKLTGGRWPKKLLGMQPIELHTTGRKSGLRRSTMLTSPVYEPDRIVLVASKGGYSTNPDWYANLDANPEVEVTVGDVTRPMTARTASAAEKAELWPAITAAYSGYEGYRANTDRDIPVVIITPR